ncbi:MAG: hypothetical protein ACTHPO_12050 [Alphaproteobacteria bacterium]
MQSRFHEGTIVERKKAGIITHPGIIVIQGNKLMVIHNTPFSGGVVLSTLSEYSNGHDVIVSKKYTPSLPPFQIAANARSAIGQKWLLFFNCQHFVTWAAGHKPNSPDLNMAYFLGFGALCLLAIKR